MIIGKTVRYLLVLKEDHIVPNFSKLSKETNIDRRTLKKYYDNDGIPDRKKRSYSSQFDDYVPIFQPKLKPDLSYKAVFVVMKEVYGMPGTYDSFRSFCRVRGLRPKRFEMKPHVRFETDPGKQIQVDWKEKFSLHDKNGEAFDFNLFSATLGYSRKHVFFPTVTIGEQDYFRCCNRMFRYLGGVPEEILTDNMSALVSISANGKRFRHPSVISYEKDSGVRIRLCKVRSPETKGKDESANRFANWIKAFDGEFVGIDGLEEVVSIVMKRCNREINPTTGVPPDTLFAKEKEYLRDLPNMRLLETYEEGKVTATVPSTLLISYHGRKYSVPMSLIGKRVVLQGDGSRLCIYYNSKLVRTYPLNLEARINYNTDDYTEALRASIKSPNVDVDKMALDNIARFR